RVRRTCHRIYSQRVTGTQVNRAGRAVQILHGLRGIVQVERPSIYGQITDRAAQGPARIDGNAPGGESESSLVSINATKRQHSSTCLGHAAVAGSAISTGPGIGDLLNDAAVGR